VITINTNQNKYQKKIEKLLDSNPKQEMSEWKKGSKKRAEASRRAMIRANWKSLQTLQPTPEKAS